MIASNVDPFPAADLDTNRNGRLTDTQRKRLQGLARAGRKDEFILAVVAAGAAVALLVAPGLSLSVYVRLAVGAILLVVAVILLRTAIGGDSLTKDLRSGRVDRVEGAIGRDTRQQQGQHYMHTLYYLSVAGQTYEVDSTTYNAAPDAGIVSLYVLPRSRAIVNLERMPDRPLPAGVTTSPAAVMGVAMAALNPFDSVKSAEARAEIAAIGNAMHAQMASAATPPPPNQRDPRPLAEAILGTWQTGPISMTFMPDGTLVAGLPGGRQHQGRWSIGSDGRLHSDSTGPDRGSDAWVAGDVLTISENGEGMSYRRVAAS
jgi:membrane protein implicated in regulation of membrane protease activity